MQDYRFTEVTQTYKTGSIFVIILLIVMVIIITTQYFQLYLHYCESNEHQTKCKCVNASAVFQTISQLDLNNVLLFCADQIDLIF